MAIQLDHLVLTVNDVPKSVEFYVTENQASGGLDTSAKTILAVVVD
jgi:catechol 2,3-dioxygenase-like lactoylglutathione lyase family enzyme